VIRTGWIEKLLSVMLPEELEQDKDNNDIDNEDEIGTNLSIAA
jgi:hypothetical protein